MPVTAGPIYPGIKDGLVFAVDPANKDSWVGPTSDTVDSLVSYNPISGSIYNDTSGSYGDNESFDFDGTDDHLNFGNNNIFSFGNSSVDSPFSISAWVNMDDATRFRIVNKYNVNNPKEWLFAVGGNDTLRLNLYDNSNQNYIGRKSTSTLTSYQGQWIHVACTYDGSSSVNGIKLYLNDSRLGETDNTSGGYTAMENTTQPLLMGYQGNDYTNGKIGPTLIYNRVLEDYEVLQNYNRLKGRFGLS